MEPFDWGPNYQRLNIPPEDLIIYEMGVRSFTAGESSGLPQEQRGTYAGLAAKAGDCLNPQPRPSLVPLQVTQETDKESQMDRKGQIHMCSWGCL